MNTQARGRKEFGIFDGVLLVFFSLLTAGILPAIFFGLYFSRRKRYKRFLVHGLPATASVLDRQDETIGFDEKLTRERGDPIQILYLPDGDFDSVIISTT